MASSMLLPTFISSASQSHWNIGCSIKWRQIAHEFNCPRLSPPTGPLSMAPTRTTPPRRSREKAQGRNIDPHTSQRKQSQVKKSLKPMTRPTVETATSLGEAIHIATSVPEYLSIIDKFVWLPTDEGLPPHLRAQAIHHDKRRRWGSQLLEGLGNAALAMWENDPRTMLQQLEPGGGLRKLWTDKRLLRTILSVEHKFDKSYVETPEKEGVWIASALKGLHVLSSCIIPVTPSHSSSQDEVEAWINIHRGISSVVQSADRLLSDERTPMKDTVEVRWAIRGLVARLQAANSFFANNTVTSDETISKERLSFTTPNINTRASKLPFDILPHCLPWEIHPSASLEYNGYPAQSLVSDLLESIPFNFDTLTTRTGNAVVERRGTAWLAEEGIGALAYSGKLMRPVMVPENVRGVMRNIEQWCAKLEDDSLHHSQIVYFLLEESLSNENSIPTFVEFVWDDGTSSDLPFQELGQYIKHVPAFFDCALCNHYPDGNSACKFHTDPEHGSHWHRTTAVVSCGTSRRFAFRPIPDISTWSEWDSAGSTLTKQTKDEASCAPAVTQLFPGDVVLMTGACNDLFHHAVYASPFDVDGAQKSRVSLVFKRALERGGGRKGHSVAGEGRRARRNK
ncbi:hypothetical protein HJC23_002932 [Cyclotella cryptica]|uniref:Fe2OG dioxygenase domain-containing protein n=1 Tax=Cyclotella cryptica TaxID=29204 RepID=A0ABD3PSF2_9STRA|eukprot:CCRYP_012455-RA/>CCRYP_012455-RA protein AED:0.30 eAED:0.30 QI:0/-1/0/1/-1/1/1/0/623